MLLLSVMGAVWKLLLCVVASANLGLEVRTVSSFAQFQVGNRLTVTPAQTYVADFGLA